MLRSSEWNQLLHKLREQLWVHPVSTTIKSHELETLCFKSHYVKRTWKCGSRFHLSEDTFIRTRDFPPPVSGPSGQQVTGGNPRYSTGHSARCSVVTWGGAAGRDARETQEERTRTWPMQHCPADTNTTVSSNYSPIKNKTKQKKWKLANIQLVSGASPAVFLSTILQWDREFGTEGKTMNWESSATKTLSGETKQCT